MASSTTTGASGGCGTCGRSRRCCTTRAPRQLKLFLHISHEEQGRRLQKRLDDPEKRWKFDPSDLVARKQWDEYHEGYEVALTATSTECSPWYVVPADHKWARDVAVARLLVETLTKMRPEIPPPLESLDGIAVD